MKALAALLLLVACDSREAPAPPQARAARIAPTASRATTPALPSRTSTVPGLEQDLKDADPKVRRAAVREAAREADADPQVFLAASRDHDREVAIVATEALAKLHARGELPASELIARATDRSLDERVRVSAINGLGLVASADAARTLAELVHRGDTLEKRSAAILLVHQDPEVAVPALIDALADADEVVRANALEALRGRARGRDFGSDAGAWRAWWQSRSR
jgi:HEAT repeat protein